MIISLALAGLLSFFLPAHAKAEDSFIQQSPEIVWQSQDSIYRYRENVLWQKSNLPAIPTKSVVFKNNIYTLAESNLYVSSNGVVFEKYNIGSNISDIKSTSNFLLLLSDANELYLSKDGNNYSSFEYTGILADIAENNQVLNWFETSPSSVSYFSFINNSVEERKISPCTTAITYVTPKPLVSCSEGTFYGENFTKLESPSVNWLSGRSIYAGFIGNTIYTLDTTNNIQNKYEININIAEVKVIKDRIFIKSTDGFYELDKLNSQLYKITDDTLSVFSDNVSDYVLMKSAKNSFVSNQLNTWVPLSNSSKFTLTTLSIQDYYIGPTFTLLEVLNSSKVPVLYKADGNNYEAWKLMTLPKTPTIINNISEIRKLPATSLVEITGVAISSIGATHSREFYILDDTGGIQVYLDSSIDITKIQELKNRQLKITGEISSAQAKRIAVGITDIFNIGETKSIVPKIIEVTKINDNLGNLVLINGTVEELGTDYFILKNGETLVKIHYPSPKDTYIEGDEISIVTIIDYNSSSKQTEGWSAVGQVQITNRAETVTQDTEENAAAVVSAIKSTVSTKKVSASKASIQSSKPTVIKSSAIITDPKNTIIEEGLGLPVKSEESNYLTSLIGLITGALAMRGKRFQQILRL